jgi:MYXO-CTERM domain-containing protein
LAAPATAHAFCGFYVEGSGEQLFNDATQVVLMRMGTRTVLSMQNNYKGPAEDFAMVIPVPVVLKETDVQTLDKAVFAKVDGMGAPRLVEYWEQDPCAPEMNYEMAPMATGMARGSGSGYGAGDDKDYGVKVEAEFVVGEYQIVILSATEATGLEAWLGKEGYKIPPNAEPLLRPYVDAGSKFFVAKVDPKKVTFENGRAALSPLRFHYDHDEFTLPIRLGLANSAGKQDLIVTVLSPEGRYEMANYENATIPTNLEVKDEVRTRFGEFYAALYDRTLEKHPGAVITEYSWSATSCDPCPGPQLDYHDLATLGSDVLAAGGKPYDNYDFTMTRLHARYGADDVKDDLVFKKATPIVGGREFVIDQKTGKLEEGAKPDPYTNNFQGRYAIRHEWTSAIDCKDPIRNRWGGPPANTQYQGPTAGKDLAFAPRGNVQLASLVEQDIPEVDVKADRSAAPTKVGAGTGTGSGSQSADRGSADKPAKKKKSGCGCATSEPASAGLLGLALFGLLRRRKRA